MDRWYAFSVLFSLVSPTHNTRGPLYMEQALAALHRTNCKRIPVVLEFGFHANEVGLYLRCPHAIAAATRQLVLAHFPDCTVLRLPENALDPPIGLSVHRLTLQLSPDIFPTRLHHEFDDFLNHSTADPLSGILAMLSTRQRSLWCSIRLRCRPAPLGTRRHVLRIIDRLSRPFFTRHPFLSEVYATAARSRWRRPLAWALACASAHCCPASPERPAKDLDAARDKADRHLYLVTLELLVAAPRTDRRHAKRKLQQLAGAFAHFTLPSRATFRPRRRPRPFLLSDAELATLFHPATESVRTESMATSHWREMEPPAIITSGKGKGEARLGRLKFRSRREVFGIARDDRRRHLAVIGKTGMGKTTLLQNLIASDIATGHGVGLLDPHGDLAESLLDLVPSRRTNDVILFDVGDWEHPVAFNPLACPDPMQRPLVAASVLSAFKKLYADSWGPRLEHILRNALLALLEVPGTSLLSLQQMLANPSYRKTVVGQVSDPVVRSFWIDEFGAWNDRFRSEAVAPIQNKVGQFLSNPILRAITGQAKSTIDLPRAMDAGQVLIVNLSKGRVGEDASSLLGSLLVTSIQQAAMARAGVREEDRRDFYLYVDEFQNFATESFATILSEARKYRLNLTIANQYLAQMDEPTRDAVFGNVGSLVCFQVGAQDAEILAEQLAGDVTEADLIALPRFTAYVRLLVEGMPTRPFSMETLPAARSRRGRGMKVRKNSRHRYGRRVDVVAGLANNRNR